LFHYNRQETKRERRKKKKKKKYGNENLELYSGECDVSKHDGMKTENRVGMRILVEVGRDREREREREGERRDKAADKMMIVLGGRQYKGRLWRLVVMMMICKTNYIVGLEILIWSYKPPLCSLLLHHTHSSPPSMYLGPL
jgi:hypothetical protein